MVFTAVEQRRVQYSSLTPNDAVVAVHINYLAAFENILRVLPDTKNVTVVVGTSPIEKYWSEEIAREVSPLVNRVAFTWTGNLSFDELLKHAAALPPHSAIFWELMIVDAAGVVHEGGAPLAQLHAVANAPIFSYDEAFFGQEIVGGPLLLVQDSSRQTAAVAVRVLGGEKAGDIKTSPVEFAAPRFDWREMQRWGISESRLPPGSEIHFRNPTVWEQYRWQIIAVTAALLLQTLLIAVLFHERRHRRMAEVEARHRMDELAHMNRHATAGELSSSIAHELNQPLGAILNNTETATMLLDSPSPDVAQLKEILADIKRDDQRASKVIVGLRRLLKIKEFKAEDVDLNDLAREVSGLLSAQASARKIVLSSILFPEPLGVRGDPVQIQQVILNLIVNGMDATASTDGMERKVTCRTALIGGEAEISIADNGPGISQDKLGRIFEPFFTTKDQGMGMGLSISRTIVEHHYGRIWAENQADGGSVFRVRFPLAKQANADGAIEIRGVA
jgi:signal transduction histidine kinase